MFDEDADPSKVQEEFRTPLQWWKQHEREFPVLARLARKFLSIPASSAEPERTWSAAGYLCSSLRAKLSDSTVAQRVFLHHNLSLLK